MRDARQGGFGRREPEIPLGQSHGMAFRIENPRLPVLKIAGFTQELATRIEFPIPRFRLRDAVDSDTNVMVTDFHVELVELLAVPEDRKVKPAVGEAMVIRG